MKDLMEYGICTVAAAPLRKEPMHRSEMISQLLFGETVKVLDKKEEWLFVRSLYDDYEGWLTEHLVSPVHESEAYSDTPYVSTGLLNPVLLPDQLINAPMGSSLTGLDEESRKLWDEQYRYHGTYRNVSRHVEDSEMLEKIVQAWINAPYLWGGRTFMGVDCSGFVQVVFKMLGKKLKRDAWMQAEQGEKVDQLEAARKGDLAFFSNDNGKIIHVGILLSNDSIIHASGKVRIDPIDHLGIIHSGNGKRTHRLSAIRRYF